MANISVRKIVTTAGQVGGLENVRYERSAHAYGVIPQASYVTGDVLVFDALASEKVLYARIVSDDGSTGVEYVQGGKTALDAPITFAGATGDLRYFIVYRKGAGKETLKVTLQA